MKIRNAFESEPTVCNRECKKIDFSLPVTFLLYRNTRRIRFAKCDIYQINSQFDAVSNNLQVKILYHLIFLFTYSSVILKTTELHPIRPIRFGTDIRPLKMSEISQTVLRLITDPRTMQKM